MKKIKFVFPKVEVESYALVSKGGTKELFSPFSVSVMKLMDDLKTAR